MGTTKNTGAAGEAAALPGATVLRLPTAVAAPVQQEGRRGRHPKGITSLWRARSDRAPHARVMRLRAQLDLIRQARADSYDEMRRVNDQIDALRKRDAEIGAIYRDLVSRDEALCAELQAIGAPAPTYREFLGLAAKPVKGGAA